jgi:hypothetical protein
VNETVSAIEDFEFVPNPANADEQAKVVLDAVFDSAKWVEDLQQEAAGPLIWAFVEGAQTEIAVTSARLAEKAENVFPFVTPISGEKRATAAEIAQRLGYEIPDGAAFDELPEWLRVAAWDELQETFGEPYWQKVPETTRDDVERTLRDGIRDGYSVPKLAKEIKAIRGPTYALWRGTNTARTEVSHALNGGHSAGISQLQQETGLRIDVEWLSVLGSTTRESHAALDGKTVRQGENFNLSGYMIPWPAHRSLPAGERINCQCTVLSAPSLDAAATEAITAVPPQLPKMTTERCGGLMGSNLEEMLAPLPVTVDATGNQKKPQTSCGKTKSEIAKANAKRVAKEVQRYSEERNERDLAQVIGGKSLDNREPVDVQIKIKNKLHGIELKTMVDNKHDKVSMKRSARENKAAWERRRGHGHVSTVVFNDENVIPGKTLLEKTKALERYLETGDDTGFDFSKRRIFYRRGYGNFYTRNMYEAKDMDEVRELSAMTTRELPEGAGR